MQAPPLRRRGLQGFVYFFDAGVNIDGITLGSVNCLVDPGGLRIAKGPGAAAGRGDVNAFLAGDVVAGCTTKKGNVAAYRNTTYMIAGDSGSAYIEGIGTYTIQSYTSIIIAGAQYPLAIPPPSVTLVDPSTYVDAGQPSGAISARGTYYRSTTKGESNASEATPTVVYNSEKVHVNIPARPVTNASITAFRLYLSKQGEGPLQINYYYKEYVYGVDVPIGGGVVAVDYNDGDLNIFVQAPYILNAAPDSQFIAVMGGFNVAIGCEPKGGFLIWPSIFQRLESFDANSPVVMNPMQSFTAVHGGGNMQDGLLLLGQADAISAAFLSGDLTVPVVPRALFRGVGVASGAQLESVYGTIVALSGSAGLWRSGRGDEPETAWTEPIKPFLAGFDPLEAVVRHDPSTDMLVVAGANSVYGGNCAIGYYWGRPGDTWTSPIPLGFLPKDGFVQHGKLYITDGTNRYAWESGANASATAVFQPTSGGDDMLRKTVERFVVYSNATTVDVTLTRGIANTNVIVHNGIPVTDGQTDAQNTLVGRVPSFSSKVTWTGAGKYCHGIAYLYSIEEAM